MSIESIKVADESKQGFEICHDLYIKTSRKKLFDAVSLPEHLMNWWPKICKGNPAIGAAYNFYFTPEYDWKAEVIKCEINGAFHLKMTEADADWTPTSFGFDLVEVKQGEIQLKFWHRDWPACNDHFRKSSFCWAILLQGLKNYVERGVVVPFEERE